MEKTALYKPRREAVEETKPTNTLISDPQNCEKMYSCCVSPQSVVFCTTAPVDSRAFPAACRVSPEARIQKLSDGK